MEHLKDEKNTMSGSEPVGHPIATGSRRHVEAESGTVLQRQVAKEFARGLRHARRALATRKLELAVDWCRYATMLAWKADSGCFYSHDLEQLLGEIGRQHFGVCPFASPAAEPPRRFLHVMSTAYETGGHTRVVSRWIETCARYAPLEHHSILISMQRDHPLPAWLGHSAAKTGGEIIELPPGLSWLEAAAEIRSRSLEYDAVILHIHPDDILPNIAFYDRLRPVMFFNHADHIFSLGTDLAKVIADTRPVGHDLSVRSRSPGARKILLPTPLLDEGATFCEKAEARWKTGLPADAILVLTIGWPQNFVPIPGYNFAEVIRSICEANSQVHVVAVGLTESEPFPGLAQSVGGRFLPVGVVIDREILELYYSAADIYLDAYPSSSGTAVLDAARHGLPVQRLYNRYQRLMWGEDPALDSVLLGVSTQDEFITNTLEWLAWPEDRRSELGGCFRNAVLQDHCGAFWKSKWLDPAVSALTQREQAPSELAPKNSYSNESAFHGFGIAVPANDWPSGMFVAGTIDSYEDASHPIRISGVFHSIRPLLFHSLVDGTTWHRLSLFTWLLMSCLPDHVRTAPRRLLRAIFKNPKRRRRSTN